MRSRLIKSGRRATARPPVLPPAPSKMNRLLLGVAFGLALGAKWQIQRLFAIHEEPVAALRVGDPLPTGLGFESEDCWVGFFVNTDCSFCRELIAQAHQREDLRWIISGRRTAIDALLEEYPIRPDRIRMAIAVPRGQDPFAEIGVWAVPTRVLGSGLRVTHLTVGGKLPSRDSIASLCGGLSK